MFLHRALTIPNLCSATRTRGINARFRPNYMVRWQQTGATGGGGRSGARKLLLYMLTGAGVTAAGSIAYSSYDPGFKNTVNKYLPGFSSVTDSVAGQWKSIIGSTQNSKRVELVYKAERSKDTHVAPKISKPVTTKIETVTVTEKPKMDIPPPVKKETISKTTPTVTQPELTKPPEATLEASPIIETTPIAAQRQPERTLADATKATEVEAIERPVDEDPPTEPEVFPVEEQTPQQMLYPVESAVASVREETERVAEKILSEQVKDHQSSQSIREQWMQDTSKVDAKLQETFEDLKALSSKVAAAQGAVIEAVKSHQQKMFEVIKSNHDGTSTMETLAEDIASSEVAIEDRKKELDEATLKLQEKTADVSYILTAAGEVGLKSKAEEIEGDVTKLMADLDIGENSLLEAESSSEVLRDYREEARRSREQLQRELGTVPPQADLKQEAIILMQSKRIDVLKQKLDEIEQEKATSLGTALDKQKQKLEELAVEKVKLKLQRQRLQMDQEYARKESEIAHEFEGELREKIRLQSEAHASHLRDALSSQADELGSVWSQELELKLVEQEAQYQIEMSKAMARLRGIESMVNTIANAGELTRHQQIIRNACDTLSGALDQANAYPDDRFTISKEIASLRKAARGDNFVLSVIESIPKQASSESAVGIQSESGLQERFQKVYRISKRVSLVPDNGGGLGTYALSYLQSLLVFNLRGVKETKDIDLLDTFELLSLANSSVQKGDLEKAVWYVSHLRNESGRVARDWLEDARLYLETQQAVRVIQTYTSATNIAFN